ncbi:MAG: type 4a pilus biogenesis protein PilO [Nitrospinota bacterium]
MESFKEKIREIFASAEGLSDKIPYERIAEFPSLYRRLIIGIFLLMLLLIYYFTLYGVQQTSITNLRDDIARQELDILKLEKTSKNLPELEQEVAEMNAKLKMVRARLPDEKEISSLLTEISRIGTQGGLRSIKFQPQTETYETYYAKVPVSMVIQGSYHDLLTFFDQISRMPRIITISDIDLSVARTKSSGESVLMEAKCLATTFRYLTEEERKSRQGAAQKN